MVGKWKVDEKSAPIKDMPETDRPKVDVDFREDGTFTFLVKRGDRSDEIVGTYKLEGNQLTMTPTVEDGKPSKEKPITVTLSDDKRSFPMPEGAGTIVKL